MKFYLIILCLLFSFAPANSQSLIVSNDDIAMRIDIKENADSSISFDVSVFNTTNSNIYLCHLASRAYPAYINASMGIILLGLGCEYGFVSDLIDNSDDSAFVIQIRAGEKYEFVMPTSLMSQPLTKSDLLNMEIKIGVNYVVSDSSIIFRHPGYVEETFVKRQRKLSLSVQL